MKRYHSLIMESTESHYIGFNQTKKPIPKFTAVYSNRARIKRKRISSKTNSPSWDSNTKEAQSKKQQPTL
jgi:hypothetical protein